MGAVPGWLDIVFYFIYFIQPTLLFLSDGSAGVMVIIHNPHSAIRSDRLIECKGLWYNI